MSDDVQQIATRIPVSQSWIDDAAWLRKMFAESIDRRVYPWRFPDDNPFPHLDWWPWIDRWRAAPGEARIRLAAALDILRHGEPDREDDY